MALQALIEQSTCYAQFFLRRHKPRHPGLNVLGVLVPMILRFRGTIVWVRPGNPAARAAPNLLYFNPLRAGMYGAFRLAQLYALEERFSAFSSSPNWPDSLPGGRSVSCRAARCYSRKIKFKRTPPISITSPSFRRTGPCMGVPFTVGTLSPGPM
jgi:hypothetical protein